MFPVQQSSSDYNTDTRWKVIIHLLSTLVSQNFDDSNSAHIWTTNNKYWKNLIEIKVCTKTRDVDASGINKTRDRDAIASDKMF